MKIQVPCGCAKVAVSIEGGKTIRRRPKPGKLRRMDGTWIDPCPLCKGTKTREENAPDSTHEMTKERVEIRCPGSTPRYYGVRECKNCGEEELHGVAGHFFGKGGALLRPCTGVNKK